MRCARRLYGSSRRGSTCSGEKESPRAQCAVIYINQHKIYPNQAPQPQVRAGVVRAGGGGELPHTSHRTWHMRTSHMRTCLMSHV
jgi:hypothetical protein